MKYRTDIKKLHDEIQRKLFLMLPEKWEKIYLYASIIEHFNKLQTGEMFFYYFPKGVLKKRPVNVYEVPSKFSIDEGHYFRLADDLYNTIKKLRELQIECDEKPWSNITIAIENLKYRVIYGYEDLNGAEIDNQQRRIIWSYRYLKLPYESFSRSEREIIHQYERQTKPFESVYELPLYHKKLSKEIVTVRDIEKKYEFVTEEKIEEMKFKSTHIPKSQILSTK